MECYVHTYIQDNPANLEPVVLKELNQLIMVRDQVFFPDYKKYNYIPKEPIIRIEYYLRMFKIDLISLQNNRSLDINCSWLHEVDPLRGSFTYSINLIHSEKGYGEVMHVPLLAKKRQNIDLLPTFFAMKNYQGNFTDKARGCLMGIKEHCDIYAPDVLSGRYWDDKAYLNPLDDY